MCIFRWNVWNVMKNYELPVSYSKYVDFLVVQMCLVQLYFSAFLDTQFFVKWLFALSSFVLLCSSNYITLCSLFFSSNQIYLFLNNDSFFSCLNVLSFVFNFCNTIETLSKKSYLFFFFTLFTQFNFFGDFAILSPCFLLVSIVPQFDRQKRAASTAFLLMQSLITVFSVKPMSQSVSIG